MNSQTLLFLYIVAFVAIIYFFSIRPQMRRQREQAALIAGLNVGDRVVTAGGIAGTVRALGDDFVEVEISDGVVVEFAKGAVVAKREA